jgi:hypothetical protein
LTFWTRRRNLADLSTMLDTRFELWIIHQVSYFPPSFKKNMGIVL